jgi:RNA polymerase sigma-70 factor (ECF subfamily)
MATLEWLEVDRSVRLRGAPSPGRTAAMTADDDAALMLRYARGELRAFEALYARHRGPLYRYLLRHVHEQEVAADLFQEVWSKVIAHRARYEPRAKFRTFLFHIAHNCCMDHYRRAAARPHPSATVEVDADDDASALLPAPERDLPEEQAARAQLAARYQAALAALPREQRDVFLLFEQSGLTLEEVATITGVGTETAKSRLRYALAKLRRALVAPPGAKP